MYCTSLYNISIPPWELFLISIQTFSRELNYLRTYSLRNALYQSMGTTDIFLLFDFTLNYVELLERNLSINGTPLMHSVKNLCAMVCNVVKN